VGDDAQVMAATLKQRLAACFVWFFAHGFDAGEVVCVLVAVLTVHTQPNVAHRQAAAAPSSALEMTHR
jgi:hypothetical protein